MLPCIYGLVGCSLPTPVNLYCILNLLGLLF